MLVPVVADCNHNNPVDFTKLASSGIIGVILKARQGIGFADPKFHERRDAARAAGLKVGAYDFATHDDPVENAKDFLQFTGVDAELSYWLDFEDNRASPMSGEQAADFLDAVDQAIGRPCGIYGGNRIVEQIDDGTGEAHGAPNLWWATHPLWLCQYKTAPGLRDITLADLQPHLRIPWPWKSWFLLQYTGDGIGPLPHTVPGVENGADLNVYAGPAEELKAKWSLKTFGAVA